MFENVRNILSGLKEKLGINEFAKLFDALPPVYPISFFVALSAKNRFVDEHDVPGSARAGALFTIALIVTVPTDTALNFVWFPAKIVRVCSGHSIWSLIN